MNKQLPCDNTDWKCSASTLNLFIKDPCLFILKYYYGLTTEFNEHAMRGKAVEYGVDRFYETNNIKESINDSLNKFFELTFDLDYLVNEIEDVVPQWTNNCINAMLFNAPIGIPYLQTKLTFEVEGIPFVGYLDYEFEEQVIDLKTTNKVPRLLVRGDRKGRLPAAKNDNVRQQVLYMIGSGKPCHLLYVSPNEELFYKISKEEKKEFEKEIKKELKKMKILLTKGLEYGIMKYTPNKSLFKSFYYNQEMIDKCKEIWNV